VNGRPEIDLAAEAAMSAGDVALVVAGIALVLLFVVRARLRRRRGATSGLPRCASCGSAGGCPISRLSDHFTHPPCRRHGEGASAGMDGVRR